MKKNQTNTKKEAKNDAVFGKIQKLVCHEFSKLFVKLKYFISIKIMYYFHFREAFANGVIDRQVTFITN